MAAKAWVIRAGKYGERDQWALQQGVSGGGWKEFGDLTPYATKEAVGGYFILEADDLDAAIEVAARVPAARLGGAIEIRAVSRYW